MDSISPSVATRLPEEEKENFKGDPVHPLDHSRSPLCKDGSQQSRHWKRSSEKLELIQYAGQGADSVHHSASVKLASHQGAMETGPTMASRLKDVSNSLATSKELVKVLFRLWRQENQNSSNVTLVSALKVEIDSARHQVYHLMHEKRHSKKEIDSLLKQFACEKSKWKRKEQERIANAVSSLSRELETEKKLRKQTERLNKTLGLELSKVVEELGCERRAREILERTCDELAEGLGAVDRTELEEMKREYDKVREEAERERHMLQLADLLREERVQMKLADARYEYEEKNAALERLRTELQSYLGEKARISHGEDSVESELHSIELNMDNRRSFGNVDSRRASVEEVFKGRRSLCEKIQWESICLQRKTSDRKANDNAHGDTNDPKSSILGEDCSRPQSPPELGDSKTSSVDSGDDQIDDGKE